tara:strand:+ start:197 stop:514 length:318 start_codon:yes stop_codon:yes gene_type:complete
VDDVIFDFGDIVAHIVDHFETPIATEMTSQNIPQSLSECRAVSECIIASRSHCIEIGRPFTAEYGRGCELAIAQSVIPLWCVPMISVPLIFAFDCSDVLAANLVP